MVCISRMTSRWRLAPSEKAQLTPSLIGTSDKRLILLPLRLIVTAEPTTLVNVSPHQGLAGEPEFAETFD
jgi:hypothetical protein